MVVMMMATTMMVTGKMKIGPQSSPAGPHPSPRGRLSRPDRRGCSAVFLSYCYGADEVIEKWMMKMAKMMAKVAT